MYPVSYTPLDVYKRQAHINIPHYIGMINGGFYEESLGIIREKTPLAGVLGRVCVHPCEANCRRLLLDEALSIRVLKRFVADFAVSYTHLSGAGQSRREEGGRNRLRPRRPNRILPAGPQRLPGNHF